MGVKASVLLYDHHPYNDRLQRTLPLARVLEVVVLEHRMGLLVQQLMSYLQQLQLLELLVDAATNADRNELTLPPPDDDGRGWLPSPGLPEPDSTPSFGHPIHTDDTTKHQKPDLQLFGAWSVAYMSTMAHKFKSKLYLRKLCFC